jgi:hypothetical protein
MSAGLQTLSSSDVTLLRGKDGWRMAGAVLDTNWARELDAAARKRAARVFELADRFIRGEHEDAELFKLLSIFLQALEGKDEDDQDAIEILTVVRLLHILGLDDGDTFGASDDFSDIPMTAARSERTDLIARINRGITSSGL